MIEQQRGRQNFDDHAIGGAPLGQLADYPSFEQLVDHNEQENKLFVIFVDGRKKREAAQKDQPNKIDPINRRSRIADRCGLALSRLKQSLTRCQ